MDWDSACDVRGESAVVFHYNETMSSDERAPVTLQAYPRSSSQMRFADLLKDTRNNLGSLTQRELADTWGVSASLVQKLEVGEHDPLKLSIGRLEALRQLTGASVHDFYTNVVGAEPIQSADTEAMVAIPFFSRDVRTMVPMPRQALEPYDVTLVAGFRVDQTFAAPDAIKFAIPLGSSILVHMNHAPVHGEWSFAHVEEEDVSIIYKHEDNRSLFLRSYENNNALAFADMQGMRILGPLVSYYVPSPRLQRLREG